MIKKYSIAYEKNKYLLPSAKILLIQTNYSSYFLGLKLLYSTNS